MPQMMPLPWVTIFLISTIRLWTLMTMVFFFLYPPHSFSSTKGFFNQTIYLNWKW